MRISDWSSDVCSSDLITRAEAAQPGRRRIEIMAGIESMRGVIEAVPLCEAHPRITTAFFGAEEFGAGTGGRASKGHEEVVYPRTHVWIETQARHSDKRTVGQERESYTNSRGWAHQSK